MPLADGGEGTAAALLTARGGEWRQAAVHDALGRPVDARFAWLGDGTAAWTWPRRAACGGWPTSRPIRSPRAPLGAGELLRAAAAAGARRLIVGVGGTASTDGGAGLRQAWAACRRGVSSWWRRWTWTTRCSAQHGAAAVYGPQKGASPEQVAELERRLAALGLPTAGLPGAGAGGGIGGDADGDGRDGATAARGWSLDEVGLDNALAGAGLCITAEGRVDEQTLRGKVVAEVAACAARLGVAGAAWSPGRSTIAQERARRAAPEQGDLERAGRAGDWRTRAAGWGENRRHEPHT